MPNPTVRCSRCGHAVSIYSDESREWLYLEAGGDEFGAVCRDCLTPEEADGYRQDLRRMQETSRRIRRHRS